MQIRDKDRDELKIRSLYRQHFQMMLLRSPKNHDNNKYLVKGLLFNKYFFYFQTISLDTQRSLLEEPVTNKHVSSYYLELHFI